MQLSGFRQDRGRDFAMRPSLAEEHRIRVGRGDGRPQFIDALSGRQALARTLDIPGNPSDPSHSGLVCRFGV